MVALRLTGQDWRAPSVMGFQTLTGEEYGIWSRIANSNAKNHWRDHREFDSGRSPPVTQNRQWFLAAWLERDAMLRGNLTH